jgi:hypothetical protein
MPNIMTLKQISDVEFVSHEKEGNFDKHPIKTIDSNIEFKEHNMNKNTIRK